MKKRPPRAVWLVFNRKGWRHAFVLKRDADAFAQIKGFVVVGPYMLVERVRNR